ncbi:MAG: CotH kinase family protein [Clostridia bacterium]|nr:CotH kinase family protein [Clostridia bacterium]
MSTKKKIFITFLICLSAFLLFGCVEGGQNSTPIPDASEGDIQVSAPEFSTASEVKRALVKLTDEKLYRALYTEEWYKSYREIVSEVNDFVISPPENDSECISQGTALYEKLLVSRAKAEYARTDVPTVHIYADREIGREEYIEAKVFIIDSVNGTYGDIEETITIRIRGNSTAAAEKKPYNIKFTDKTSVLGMKEGRKWCLIANHYDKTLMRNKLAFDLSAVCGDIAAIQSRYCDVYLNNKLQGSYLICQPVSDGTLELDTKKGDFIVERIVVLEGENDFFLRGDAGYVFDTPERNELTRGEQREIIEFMEQVDDAIAAKNENKLKKLIDVDSFVSAYVIHELLKDCDMVTGSPYFYRKDGILYAGPIWDMDLSTGNVSRYYFQDKYHIYNNADGYGDKSGDSASGIWAQQEWFKNLMKCSFFSDAVKAKYASISKDIENLYSDGGYIDTLCQTYGESFARNYNEAGWSISHPYSDYEDETPERTFEANVKELKEWLSRRDAYLKEYFGIK